MTLVEKVARALAFSAGSSIVGTGQSAATREFGWKGDGAHFQLYVEAHWKACIHPAEFAISAMRNPPDLGAAPRYVQGMYSRRNIEAFIDDALSVPVGEGT